MANWPRDRVVSWPEYQQLYRQQFGKNPTPDLYEQYVKLQTSLLNGSFQPGQQPPPQVPGGQNMFGGPLAGGPPNQISGYQSGPGADLFGGQQQGGGFNLGGTLGDIGKWLLQNWQLPMAAVGVYQNAKSGQKAENLQNEALGISRERWAAGEPLRGLAMDMLQRPMPAARDLSAGFSDPGNPYNRIMPAAPQAQAPQNTPMPPPGNNFGTPQTSAPNAPPMSQHPPTGPRGPHLLRRY